MKTLQDCKDRVAQRRGVIWNDIMKAYSGTTIPWMLLHQAAELYGRYMRFVGRAQVRGEVERLADEKRYDQRSKTTNQGRN